MGVLGSTFSRATPTWACLRAPTSLVPILVRLSSLTNGYAVPSPHMSVVIPSRLRAVRIASFWSGDVRANTRTCEKKWPERETFNAITRSAKCKDEVPLKKQQRSIRRTQGIARYTEIVFAGESAPGVLGREGRVHALIEALPLQCVRFYLRSDSSLPRTATHPYDTRESAVTWS